MPRKPTKKPAKKAVELPLSLDVKIPPELLKQFGDDVRFVVRHPGTTGIIAPERLLGADLVRSLGKDFQVVIVPKK